MDDKSNCNARRHVVEDALKSVCSSSEFRGADRLMEFLTYVVNETLEGRGDDIRGKRIAQDVYATSGVGSAETGNVVRVDASRLRRRLELYYSGSGASDPLRIFIDKGGYLPRFDEVSPPYAKQAKETSVQSKVFGRSVIVPGWVLALLVGTSIYGIVHAFGPAKDRAEVSAADTAQMTRREVLFEQSATSLMARNVAEEARGLMFPATEPRRVQAILVLFEEAIDLDPDYFGGYAGAAQTATMIGGVSPPGPTKDEMLNRARSFADKAVKLAPASSWSQSALAFLKFVQGNYDEANRLSKRAVELDHEDLHALDLDAIIALFSGDFERAAGNMAPEIHLDREGSRFPWRNALGNAQFHLGNHDVAIHYLKEAAALGDPVSEINNAHLIAAYQASGQHTLARSAVEVFRETWPNSRVDMLLRQLFQNEKDADNVISGMRNAGWGPMPARLHSVK